MNSLLSGRLPTLLILARRSLLHRRHTVSLLVLSLLLGASLLLGVERLRNDLRENFTSTIAGTDLLVGARSSPTQLLLHAIFHQGEPTQGVSVATWEMVSHHPRVAWTIPLSLGDTHRGFRVLGTDNAFFLHYRYGQQRALSVAGAAQLAKPQDAIIGAAVAATLGYRIGDEITIAHGLKDLSFARHDKHPFVITGIMSRTGTPLDNLVVVSLEALAALHDNHRPHAGRKPGAKPPGDHHETHASAYHKDEQHHHDEDHHHEEHDHAATAPQGDAPATANAKHEGHTTLPPGTELSAFLVGMKSRAQVFSLQHALNKYRDEPLTALIPGVTLGELWKTLAIAENALFGVSMLVTLVSLSGMIALLLATLNERRREMALLRAVGVSAGDLLFLVCGEALLMTVLACALAFGLVNALAWFGSDWLQARAGFSLHAGWPSLREAALLGGIVLAAGVASLLPAIRAYRMALADGLTPR